MATTITATKQGDLPAPVPISIVKGDTFRSPIYRHKNADGSYIDTSGWVVTGKIYARQACGAPEVIDLTIEHQPGPKFGYRATLTKAQTAGLSCADNWYTLPTDDGTTARTYYGGPAKIKGVG